jgi:hypothetical protein
MRAQGKLILLFKSMLAQLFGFPYGAIKRGAEITTQTNFPGKFSKEALAFHHSAEVVARPVDRQEIVVHTRTMASATSQLTAQGGQTLATAALLIRRAKRATVMNAARTASAPQTSAGEHAAHQVPYRRFRGVHSVRLMELARKDVQRGSIIVDPVRNATAALPGKRVTSGRQAQAPNAFQAKRQTADPAATTVTARRALAEVSRTENVAVHRGHTLANRLGALCAVLVQAIAAGAMSRSTSRQNLTSTDSATWAVD